MKNLLIVFLVVSIANLAVFFFRDHFRLVQQASYNDLYQPCAADCRAKWQSFPKSYSTAELQKAKQLTDSLMQAGATTLEKTMAIGHFLYRQFHTQKGYPQPIIHRSSPVTQFQLLSQDTSMRLWCGTWVHLFSFFCWSQNIINRNVEIAKPGDHHMLTECYLPETKEWVMVDLTNNALLITKDGKLLNSRQFTTALASNNNLQYVEALTLQQQTLSDSNIRSAMTAYYGNYTYYYYYTLKPQQLSGFLNKFMQYIYPRNWYEIYSSSRGSNDRVIVKQVLLATWFLLFLSIIAILIHDRGKKHS